LSLLDVALGTRRYLVIQRRQIRNYMEEQSNSSYRLTPLNPAIVAELHLQLFSNILGSDRIVVTSLTFRGNVTSLHDHMTDLDSP